MYDASIMLRAWDMMDQKPATSPCRCLRAPSETTVFWLSKSDDSWVDKTAGTGENVSGSVFGGWVNLFPRGKPSRCQTDVLSFALMQFLHLRRNAPNRPAILALSHGEC